MPVLLVAEADLERVLVAPRAEERGAGAAALDQGVEGDGRAVDDELAVVEKRRHLLPERRRDEPEAVADRIRRVVRCRRRLEELDRLLVADEDQVGERPPVSMPSR